ncbi:hypothetical protein VitviT2T_024434 [Vitis vinifera]|uniref:Uncharacterized protein n=1 Tax=Vitis vinifera TaxID=29760 RepID=A0ABY9DHP3_VITVI|nr:hypothetical protein VitviT2T_024434 [Vitis vinifera]
MSFRDENEDGRDLQKPFLHIGSWYIMGLRQSSMVGSSQVIRDNSVSVVACVLINNPSDREERGTKTLKRDRKT